VFTQDIQLFILYAFWKFLIKKLHEVVAFQKNVYSMYGNFDLLDMDICLHTNTIKTTVKVLNVLVVATYTHRRKTSMVAKIFDLVPRFKKKFRVPCCIYLFNCTKLIYPALVQTI
jgi:hypothetical protein